MNLCASLQTPTVGLRKSLMNPLEKAELRYKVPEARMYFRRAYIVLRIVGLKAEPTAAGAEKKTF